MTTAQRPPSDWIGGRKIDRYDEMSRETDPAKQRVLIRALEKYVLDNRGARELFAVVLPDGSAPVVCEGLEDQPEPLRAAAAGEVTPPAWHREPASRYRSSHDSLLEGDGFELYAVGSG